MPTETRTDRSAALGAELPWNAHMPYALQAAAALRREEAAAAEYPAFENAERREAALRRWRGLR